MALIDNIVSLDLGLRFVNLIVENAQTDQESIPARKMEPFFFILIFWQESDSEGFACDDSKIIVPVTNDLLPK